MISPVASQFIRPRAAPYRPHLYTHNVYPSRARAQKSVFLIGSVVHSEPAASVGGDPGCPLLLSGIRGFAF